MKPHGIMHKTITQVLKQRETKSEKPINNTSKVIRHVNSAKIGPVLERLCQDSHSQLNAKLLYNTMCLEFLPQNIRDVTLSPLGESARQILGIIYPYAKDENSKEIINISKLLIKANGDVAKEKKALKDVKLLLNKYGDTALNEFFNEYLKNCREVWYKMHDGHDHHASDEDIFKGSIKCINESVNRNIALLNDIGSSKKKAINNSWFVLTSVASCLESSITTAPLALNYHAHSAPADQSKNNEPCKAVPQKDTAPQPEQCQQKVPDRNTQNPEVAALPTPIIINNNVSGGQGGSATIGNVAGGQGGNAKIGNVSANAHPNAEINVNINVLSPVTNNDWQKEINKDFNSYATELFKVYDDNFTKLIESVTNSLQINNHLRVQGESSRIIPQGYQQDSLQAEQLTDLSSDISLYDNVDGSLSPVFERNLNIDHIATLVDNPQTASDSVYIQPIADANNNLSAVSFNVTVNSHDDNVRAGVENDIQFTVNQDLNNSEPELGEGNTISPPKNNDVNNSTSVHDIDLETYTAPVLTTPRTMSRDEFSGHDGNDRMAQGNIFPINPKPSINVKDIISEIHKRNNWENIESKTIYPNTLFKINSESPESLQPSFEKKVEFFDKLVTSRQLGNNLDFQKNITIKNHNEEPPLNIVRMNGVRDKPLNQMAPGRRKRSDFDEHPIFTTVRTINNFNLRGGHNLKSNHSRLDSVLEHNISQNDKNLSDEKL